MNERKLNLTEKQATILIDLYQFTASLLRNDKSGHSMTHIDRVLSLAKKILVTEPKANSFIVLAAVTLHDTYDDKLFADPASAKTKVINELTKLQVDPDPIIYIIDNMSWSQQAFGTAEPLDLNGQIVQDSDRLDAIGAIGTVRAFKYGFKHQRIEYDPQILPHTFKNKREYRQDKETTLNHFYEKLFKISSLLNTHEARRIGDRRDKIMHDFVDAYIQEYNEDNSLV